MNSSSQFQIHYPLFWLPQTGGMYDSRELAGAILPYLRRGGRGERSGAAEEQDERQGYGLADLIQAKSARECYEMFISPKKL